VVTAAFAHLRSTLLVWRNVWQALASSLPSARCPLPLPVRRQLYNAALIGRLILSWFPSAPPAIVSPL
jgi:hypothetical protein